MSKIQPPVEGTSKVLPILKKPTQMVVLPSQFDFHDIAPEDRFQADKAPTCRGMSWPWSTGLIHERDPLVTGTFMITGVNYSKYENVKGVRRVLTKFHNAVISDIISEAGSGIRPEDVMIRIMPGSIENVLLHYYTTSDGSVPLRDPSLVDAEWKMKVDYAIRCRDVNRQQQAAMALYSALNSPYNMANKTASCYVKYLSPKSPASEVRIKVSTQEEGGVGGTIPQQLQQQYQQQQNMSAQPRLASPPRRQNALPPTVMLPPRVQRPITPPPLPGHANSNVVFSPQSRRTSPTRDRSKEFCPHDFGKLSSAGGSIPRSAPMSPTGLSGSNISPSTEMSVMRTIKKDMELEKLTHEIQRERRSLQQSLQLSRLG